MRYNPDTKQLEGKVEQPDINENGKRVDGLISAILYGKQPVWPKPPKVHSPNVQPGGKLSAQERLLAELKRNSKNND